MTFAALFAEARALSEAAEAAKESRARDETAARLAAVADAQARLRDRILARFDAAVREAAAAGEREVALAEFDGGDTFDGEYCYLYLFKGAREPEAGVTPLLATLKKDLAPFDVSHEWRTGTVHNVVRARW